MKRTKNPKEEKATAANYSKGKDTMIEGIHNAVRGTVKMIKASQESDPDLVKPYTHTLNYEDRILDTLARLFYFEKDKTTKKVTAAEKSCNCAVTIVEEGSSRKYYISYNSTLDGAYDKVKGLLDKISDSKSTHEDIVTYCLTQYHPFYFPGNYQTGIFDGNIIKGKVDIAIPEDDSCDENQALKKSCKNFLDLATRKCVSYQELSDLVQAIQSGYNAIQECQAAVDSALRDLVSPLIDESYERMVYFRKRLLQDAYKIKQHFKEVEDAVLAEDSFVKNPGNIHSELNLREFLKQKGAYPVYIGNSKLCCFTCHTQFLLDEEALNNKKLHYGTHGLAYALDDNTLPASCISDTVLLTRILAEQMQNSVDLNLGQNKGYVHDAALQYPPFSPFEELFVPIVGEQAA
mgnify:CR=1 FL=1